MPADYVAERFELGRGAWLRRGADATIVAYGSLAWQALQAADAMSREGLEVAVVSARFAKPVDELLVGDLLRTYPRRPLLTVEDHALAGGFGSAVLEWAAQSGLDTRSVRRLGIPDRFIDFATRSGQLAEAGLDADAIALAVRQAVERAGVGGRDDV